MLIIVPFWTPQNFTANIRNHGMCVCNILLNLGNDGVVFVTPSQMSETTTYVFNPSYFWGWTVSASVLAIPKQQNQH